MTLALQFAQKNAPYPATIHICWFVGTGHIEHRWPLSLEQETVDVPVAGLEH